jgi:predicted enzyme related to lactoylglutathione lyase
VPNNGCIGGCAWVRATLTFDGVVSKRQLGADSLEVWHHIRGDDREGKTVNVEGITWHAIVLDPEPFAATKALMSETFGLVPEVEAEGMVLFTMPNGTMLELNTPQAASAEYAFNEGGLVFGFRVDDVEAASAALEAAGCELLGEITRVEEIAYAYRRFRGPDGRVYSLNEQK